MPLVLAVLGALLVGIGSAAAECTDCDGDGFAWPLDCNDVDSTIHPGAAEVCDGHDNDCDGLVDNQPGCHTICEGPQNIGPEIIFATPSITNIAPKSVWSGAEYGIVWVATLGSNIRTLFFARVSQSGSPIGAAFRLSDGSATSTAPAMVWGPGEFGIAWADNRDGNFEIYFTRVSANGAKLGSDLRITNAASDSFHPAIAWTGSEYAIVWEDYRTNSLGDIYFVRLDSSGARLSVDIPIVHNPFGSTAPSVAWTAAWFAPLPVILLVPSS